MGVLHYFFPFVSRQQDLAALRSQDSGREHFFDSIGPLLPPAAGWVPEPRRGRRSPVNRFQLRGFFPDYLPRLSSNKKEMIMPLLSTGARRAIFPLDLSSPPII